MEALNKKKKSLNGSRILLLGVSYKKNIDDIREAPSLKLIEILQSKGAVVDYNDPYISKLPPTRKYKFDMKSVEFSKEKLNECDLVILSTNHDDYNYDFTYKHSKLIIDTRNAFKLKGIINGKLHKA